MSRVELEKAKRFKAQGHYSLMWNSLLESARLGDPTVNRECLDFLEEITGFELERILEVIDQIAVIADDFLQKRVEELLLLLKRRHPQYKSMIYERLSQYVDLWSELKKSSGTRKYDHLAEAWNSYSLLEQMTLSLLAENPKGLSWPELRDQLLIFKGIFSAERLIEIVEGLFLSGATVAVTKKGRIIKPTTRDWLQKHTLSSIHGSFGKWIRDHQPFPVLMKKCRAKLFREIGYDNFIDFRKELSKHPVHRSIFLDMMRLPAVEWKPLEKVFSELAELKVKLKTGYYAQFKNLKNQVLSDVVEAMGLQQLSKPYSKGVISGTRIRYHKLRAPSFNQAGFLILATLDPLENEFNMVEQFITEMHFTKKVVMILTFGNATEFKQLAARSEIDLIVFEEGDLFDALLAENIQKAFVDKIIDQIDISIVSPYEVHSPVTENMFYGRLSFRKRVLQTEKGYAIVGGRRLGKTSLLYKLKNELQTHGTIKAYFDCSTCRNGMDLCRRINKKLDLNSTNPGDYQDFEQSVVEYYKKNRKRIILFLDEIDHLAAEEKGTENIFVSFRTLSNEGYLRLFVTGCRELYLQVHDSKSPFQNFLEVQKLGNLDHKSAYRLVKEPLAEVGIGFDDEHMQISKLLGITSTHPNFIQIFCSELVNTLNQLNKRTINNEDIDEIAGGHAFRTGILNTFSQNLTDFEKFVLLMLVDRHRIRPEDITGVLDEWDTPVKPEEVQDMLDHFLLTSVLEKKDKYYYFAYPYLPVVVKEEEMDWMIGDVEKILHERQRGLE